MSVSESGAPVDWLSLAQAGDTTAFAQLLRQHQSDVRKQLRWLCHGDWALADDLAQNSFFQAWTHLRDYQGRGRFATWLYRIAYNQFLMHCRQHRPTEVLIESEAGEPAGPGHDDALAQALRLDVQAALRRLPVAEQAAVLHCYYLDLSHHEAALVLGVSLGTLKSQVLRAQARLRVSLSSWQPESVR